MNAQFNTSIVNATLAAIQTKTLIDRANKLDQLEVAYNKDKSNILKREAYFKFLKEWNDVKPTWMGYTHLTESKDFRLQKAMAYLGMVAAPQDEAMPRLEGYDPKLGIVRPWQERVMYTIGVAHNLSETSREVLRKFKDSGITAGMPEVQARQFEVAVMYNYGELRKLLLGAIRTFDRNTGATSMSKDGKTTLIQWVNITFPACPKVENARDYKDAIQYHLAKRIGLIKFERLLNVVDAFYVKMAQEVPTLQDVPSEEKAITIEQRASVLERVVDAYSLGQDLINKLFVGNEAIVFQSEDDFLAWADSKVTDYLEQSYEEIEVPFAE